MPLLRKAFLSPIQGIDYSKPSTFVNYENGFPQNIRIKQDDIRKRGGKSLYGQILPTAIMHLAQYPLSGGDIRLIAITQYGAFKYNPTTSVFTDITGVQLTGSDSDIFSSCVAEDQFLFTNSIDNIRKYNDSGTTSDLGGSPPKCKYMEYLSPYLVLAHLMSGTEYQTKIQWSDTGNIAAWTGGNSGSALLSHTPGDIRAIKNINEYAAVYKKDAIYLLRKVGTSEVIKRDLIATDIGLLSPRAVAGLKGMHYFMGLQDFYVFNGARIEPIGKPVRDIVYPGLNTGKPESHFALSVEEEKEIWFFVTPVDDNYPTQIWKFNYENGFWYYDTCNNIRTGTLFYSQSSETIDSMTGTIDSYTDAFDKVVASNAPLIIFGDQTGRVLRYESALSNDVGAAVDSYWESMDFLADDVEHYKRWLELDFWARGDSVKVYYSTDYGTNWTLIDTKTLTDNWDRYKIYLDVVAEHIRFRFRNNNLNESFQLRQFQPYYLVREERK